MNKEQKELIQKAIKECRESQANTKNSLDYYRRDIEKSKKSIQELSKKYEDLLILEKSLKESL